MKRNQSLTALLTIVFTAALVWLCVSPPRASAQASDPKMNPTFRTAALQPSKRDPGTNCFVVYDKTGTNWFAINPTNATIAWRSGGTLYTGVTATITILNTNSTTNFVLKVKNGLVLDGP